MELFYRELGEGGQPIIILHGVFGSSDNWVTLGRKFAEQYKMYLVDQRNHGQSPRSDQFGYEEMAADLKELIESKGIEKPIVIGHSMGGKTAMHFALQYPELLEKLMVVDISPRQYPIHHRTILDGLKSVDLSSLKTRSEADKQLAASIPEFGVRQFLLKNLYRTDGGFDWRINLPVIDANIEKVVEALGENGKTFNKPTLFLGGSKSDYIIESDHAEITQYFPQAEIRTVQDSGHWIHAEKPQEFYNETIRFVEG